MFGGISWALILQITAQTVIFIWFLWIWKISGYNTTEIAKMLTLNTYAMRGSSLMFKVLGFELNISLLNCHE